MQQQSPSREGGLRFLFERTETSADCVAAHNPQCHHQGDSLDSGAPIRQLSFLWHADRLVAGAPNRQSSFGWHQLSTSRGAPIWHLLAPPHSTGVSTSYSASKSLLAKKPPAWSSSRAAAASARAAWPLSSPVDYRVTGL